MTFGQETVTIPIQGSLIQFQRSFDPSAPLAGQLPVTAGAFGRTHCWMHCHQPLEQRQIGHIQTAGIHLLGYVHPGTYLVSAPLDLVGNPLSNLPITGFQTRLPEHIVSPDLRAYLQVTTPSPERIQVTVHILQDLDPQDVSILLKEEGFSRVSIPEGSHFAYLTLPAHRLLELALLPVSSFIELTGPEGEPEDNYGRAMHRSNLLINQSTTPGLHLDGAGVRVLVRDDGRVGPHIDFTGRINQSYCNGPEFNGTHGDMVSGIVTGAGNLRPFVKGMAPGATLYTEDYMANFLGQTMDIVNNEGVVITNSSYSDGCNDGYTGRTVTVDGQIFDNPQLMHVFSAGNAGTSDCGYGAGPFWGNITGGHKAGKNSMATANLFNDYTLETSSSRGPVFDGRIKPDISANGQNQLSTYPNHTIDFGGGTSAAAPGIAGIMAQLNQGYRLDHNGDIPPSALLKGALLTTASDLGNPGPDFIYGWGHVNAFQAHKLLTEQRYEELNISQGQIQSRMITVPKNTVEARFMIYWPDPPAMPQANTALINDLELRVYAPGSSDPFLPLILDPTPDKNKLNLPAVPGEDHLNNMEQVRLLDPEEGAYTIDMSGLTVPFGAATAYLFWEFRTEEPLLVFPAGGESFEPGQSNRIYWEAIRDQGTWSVELSIDSGANWTPIAMDLHPGARFANITYPDTFTQNGFVRLIRDGVTVSHPTSFHLLASPSDLTVVKACPDSMTYAWTAVKHASGYAVYGLGNKLMEVVGATDSAFITLPVINPLADNWLAIRSLRDSIRSERSEANRYNNGLLACKQPIDLKPDKIITPSVLAIQSCEPAAMNLVLSIRNEGLTPVSNVPMYYQIEGQDPVADVLTGTINPGGSKFFKFDQGPLFTETGLIPLNIWTGQPDDDFRYNDTLSVVVNARILNTGIVTPDYLEAFQVGGLPNNWAIINPDEAATWFILGYQEGVPDSNYAAIMPNFFNPETGQIDILMTSQIDLTATNKPALRFDLSYSGIVGFGLDTLYVDVSTDCGETIQKAVYMKTGKTLITIDNSDDIEDSWVPESPEHWREEFVDLSEFAGQKILLRFVNHSGYGNNIWIDRIRFVDEMPTPFTAGIQLSADSVCVNETLTIVDATTGIPQSYSWTFGDGASQGASTESGPHTLSYANPGWKTIQLIAGDGTVLDTTSTMVFVIPKPEAGFTWQIEEDTIALLNGSFSATEVTWYADGTVFSSSPNPQFVTTADEVTITLIAINSCDADTLSILVKTTSTQPQVTALDRIGMTPNPTSGACRLHGDSDIDALHVEVLDMSGRVVWQQTIPAMSGPWVYTVDLNQLSSGSYLLRMKEGRAYRVISFQVQR